MSNSHADSRAERTERGRNELSAFLTNRRARLSPGDVGLPPGGRRRTPGLRREEVAALAGVGLTWYTWLEQGRRIGVTASILDAVSGVLRLDGTERAHLYRLAGHAPPAEEGGPVEASAPEGVLRVLEGWLPGPAYVLDRHWRVLAGNTALHRLFSGVGGVRAGQSCLDGFLRADGGPRAALPEWEAMAPDLVAEFRAEASRYPDDAEFARIVARLSRRSTEFAGLWERQEVRDSALGTKTVAHPAAGLLRFDRTTVRIADHPGLRVVLLAPRPPESPEAPRPPETPQLPEAAWAPWPHDERDR